MRMNEEMIVSVILKHYSDLQAAYIFGSAAAEGGGPAGDVDIALLLPPESAKRAGNLLASRCVYELGSLLKKDVDLLNARLVTTVFQKEIIAGGKVIYSGDAYAREEFEMLVLSYYQKLNEERKGILEAFYKSKRAYPV